LYFSKVSVIIIKCKNQFLKSEYMFFYRFSVKECVPRGRIPPILDHLICPTDYLGARLLLECCRNLDNTEDPKPCSSCRPGGASCPELQNMPPSSPRIQLDQFRIKYKQKGFFLCAIMYSNAAISL
jgi:hypothetical protein